MTQLLLSANVPLSTEGRSLELLVDRIAKRALDPESLTHEVILFSALIAISALSWWSARLFLRKVVYPLAQRTRSKWDDALVEEHFFRKLSKLVPLLILHGSLPVILHHFPGTRGFVHTLTAVLLVLTVFQVFAAFMNATRSALQDTEKYKDKPLGSYTQLAKIIVAVIAFVIIISIVFDRNPIYIFSAMGAASAVLLLIFKDSILGFVASVQLSVNNMIHVGDWVQLEKYGADGNITDITLTTVKVRNWDMTYTTVPTYAFISDSVKNWRGMEEGNGRRIKRSLHVSMNSIRFCGPADLERYSRYELVKDHIRKTQEEISAYNATRSHDRTLVINGRNQTNIGVFRAYAEQYLKQEPRIAQEMTLMVRQLDPTSTGLPLEVYCFSRDKQWIPYEKLASDIFDHLLAAAPWFDLEIFEAPKGSDIRLRGTANA